MLSRALHWMQQGWGSVRESPGVSLLTSATIGIALVVVGAYGMALQNLDQLAQLWSRGATIHVYLDEGTPHAQWESLRATMAHMDAVASATLITPQQALQRFRARGPHAAALVEGVTDAILPATIALSLHAATAEVAEVAALAEQLGALKGVAEVDYGREELERLRSFLHLVRVGGWVVGIVLAVAATFIVSNTIRLSVYARREEIEIQQLVGATAWFIRVPFLFEGFLWGLGGGLMAAGILWLAHHALATELTAAVSTVIEGLHIRLFAARVGGAVVIAGTLLGIVGSALAVRRFLGVGIGSR